MGGIFSATSTSEFNSKNTNNWIIDPGIDEHSVTDPDIVKAYKKVLVVSKKSNKREGTSHPEELSWWLLRWTYFGVYGSVEDTKVRLSFLHKYIIDKDLQLFISMARARELATQNKGRVVVFLDSDIPGNLNFIVFTKEGFYVSMYNVNNTWKIEKPTMHQLSKQRFPELKTVKMYSSST
jgi:hypothetical protein